tara:strand:+ start:731 stop:907 length:177 start_codon:yes stop_codon:yes gene_type:complete
MSKMKNLLLTLIEKGEYQKLAQMGAQDRWVGEAHLVALRIKPKKKKTKRKKYVQPNTQ